MNELRISQVDNSTLVVTGADGIEYRVPIDEATLARLRRSAGATDVRVNPKEIQAQLRAGVSVPEIAAMTGASTEHIERYAGPIEAEREHVLTTAQAQPAFEDGGDSEIVPSFGAMISERLDIVEARRRSWTAWKTEMGTWVIKLTCEVSGIDRDARWTFDLKRLVLTPQNDEAVRLSAPRNFETHLAPSIRAVSKPVALITSQIDEGSVEDASDDVAEPFHESSARTSDPDVIETTPAAEDVLAALRRRRKGEADAPEWLREDVQSITSQISSVKDSVDISLDDFSTTPEAHETGGLIGEIPTTQAPVYPLSNTGGHRRKRPAMPSWDQIVSNTKSEDDLI